MFCIGNVGVFDAKVIYHQSKDKVTVEVLPEASGDRHGDIAMGEQEFGKAVIGNASGLGEAVHALADFNEDVAIVLEGMELVEIHDGIGDDASGNAHVFKVLHRCVEVKVLEVPGHEASIGGGDDTVEEAFDSGEVGSFRGDSTRVVNTVTPAGELNTSRVVFFRTESTDNTEVSGFAALREISVRDKEHCFSARRHCVMSLTQLAKLIFAGGMPQFTFTTLTEFLVVSYFAGVRVESISVESKVFREWETFCRVQCFSGSGSTEWWWRRKRSGMCGSGSRVSAISSSSSSLWHFAVTAGATTTSVTSRPGAVGKGGSGWLGQWHRVSRGLVHHPQRCVRGWGRLIGGLHHPQR